MNNWFLGPSAPWEIWEEEDDFILSSAMHSAKESLKKRLFSRIAALERADLSFGELVLEIKKQISESVAEGDLGTSSELTELIFTLIEIKEKMR